MVVGKVYIKEVVIQDVEKRRQPSKHYVYRIKVSWSDGKIHLIYRRYSQFFSLQDQLINLYPNESGANDPSKRIIPMLPGKILFGRSQIREVALKRKDLINDYLQKLIKLPGHISQSCLVISFLTVTKNDVESSSADDKDKEKGIKTADNITDPILLDQYVVVANFEKGDRNQIGLACGDTVEVIEKNENGWWFVTIEDEQGWAPSSYLEPIDGVREDEKELVIREDERSICIKMWDAQQPDEMSLKLGDIVSVKVKQRDGWWKVKLISDSANSVEGLVPAAHLKKFTKNCSPSSGGVEEEPRKVAAPPRQNTVKKTKRKVPERPKQPASSSIDIAVESSKDDEVVVYECAKDYVEADSGGDNMIVKKGALMTVLEKAPHGWWRIISEGQEGWIPSSHAQRKRRFKSEQPPPPSTSNKPQKEEKCLFITTSPYLSDDESILSFEANEVVDVIEKDSNGWWYVKINSKEGWAPSNYLIKYELKPKMSLQDVVFGGEVEEEETGEESYENVSVTQPSTSKPVVATKPKPDLLPKPRPSSQLLPKTSPKPLPKPSPKPRNRNAESRLNLPTQARPDLLPNDEYLSTDSTEGHPYINSLAVDVALGHTKGEIFVAKADYSDEDDSMLSFKAGQLLLVTKKEDTGWWFAEHSDKGGWVPSNYLSK